MIAFDFGPKFQLGRVVITRNAQAAIPHDEVLLAIKRHSRGDWGELDSHDVAENERSLQGSGRLFSAYRTRDGVRFYVITEGDRSVTNAKTQHLDPQFCCLRIIEIIESHERLTMSVSKQA
jgi:hypothetical protein